MDIQATKSQLIELAKQSEKIKCSFAAMTLFAPQIVGEEDIQELRDVTDKLAGNFESCASYLYTFGRIGVSSHNFAPTGRIEKLK